MGCCGNNSYNYMTQICCDGVVRSSIYGYSTGCCGNQVYNYNTQSCCYKYLGNGSYTQTVYNYATQFCCNGVIMPRTYGYNSWCCNNTVYNTSSSLCCNNTLILRKPYGDNLTCCGSSAINYQTTGCCYDQTGTVQTSYDYYKEICCNGAVKVRSSEYHIFTPSLYINL
jgi:hypothetical protein